MSKSVRNLSSDEFDFRAIPEGEAQLACYYEYARESETVRRVFQLTRPDEELSLVDLGLIEVFQLFGGNTLDLPWAQARTKIERQLAEAAANEQVEQPSFNFGKMDARAVTSKTIPLTPQYNAETGSELFMARICWQASDNQLVKEFQAFLKRQRPKEFPGKECRGKRTESVWASRLNWLGKMRVLHHFIPSELAELCPAAAHLHGDAVMLYQGRVKARKAFREIFPFLSKLNENPRSWPTRAETAAE